MVARGVVTALLLALAGAAQIAGHVGAGFRMNALRLEHAIGLPSNRHRRSGGARVKRGAVRRQAGGECAGGLYVTHLPPNRHKRLHPKAVGGKEKSTFITLCMDYTKFP